MIIEIRMKSRVNGIFRRTQPGTAAAAKKDMQQSFLYALIEKVW
jgi:hypothetical protein